MIGGDDDAKARHAAEVEAAWAAHLGAAGLAWTRSGAGRGAMRERLSAEQNHRCCYCGCRTNEAADEGRQPTIEHIMPRSRGGTDDYANLAMACDGCNKRRGDTWLAEHRQIAVDHRSRRPADG